MGCYSVVGEVERGRVCLLSKCEDCLEVVLDFPRGRLIQFKVPAKQGSQKNEKQIFQK